MNNKWIVFFLGACVVYAFFSVYLYLPYFESFDTKGWDNFVFLITPVFAGVGCFLLSLRWVMSFWGCLFAGLLYGFGPYFLGLGIYHPVTGVLASFVPWMFLPAAYGPAGKLKWLRIPFSLLPFAVIVLFFQMTKHFGFFPVSTQVQFGSDDIGGIFFPLAAAKKGIVLGGFYHTAVAGLVMGLFLLIRTRRLSMILLLAGGFVLVFSGCIFGVSSIVWMSIPMTGLSVVTAVGFNAISEAGYSDRKWVLASGIVMGLLAIMGLLLATRYFGVFAGLADGYGRIFLTSAKMYILGMLGVAIIFFITRAKLRLCRLRWLILIICVGCDVFLGARCIVDMIF